jgi:hypothetical protein
MVALTREEFDAEIHRLDRWIDRAERLPNQVFRTAPRHPRFIEFDLLLSRGFFDATSTVRHALQTKWITFGVLAPDPVDYYSSHFGKLPYLRFELSESPDSFVAALNQDPGGSPADAIADRADIVVCHDESWRWLIVGDRSIELGVVAGFDAEAGAAIESGLSGLGLLRVNEAVERVVSVALRASAAARVGAKLIENYRST